MAKTSSLINPQYSGKLRRCLGQIIPILSQYIECAAAFCLRASYRPKADGNFNANDVTTIERAAGNIRNVAIPCTFCCNGVVEL